jgi:TolB-like protein/class 3 adenylate cyclase
MAKDRLSGKLVVILHADVAGSTVLVQLDKQLAHERIQDSFQRFSNTIEKYRGHVLELRGDALLAEFELSSEAVSAALAFQVDQANYNNRLTDDLRPTIRVGITIGEVVIADNTVTGAGVVQAQRVEQLADKGGVCITAAIHEALSKRLPLDLENLGEQVLKGFDHPVHVYSVALTPGASISPPNESRQHDTAIKTRRFISAIVVVVLLLAGGTAYWFKPRTPPIEVASAERMAFPLPEKPSIAVLPFTNMSDDPKQEYFVDGMTEDLITDLSKLSGLFVIARNTVFTYRNQPVKIRQVAEELGVRYVLEGSVRRSGEQLRVNAQLIDATTGGHVWADRYDGEVKDIFSVQDAFVREIVKALSVNLSEDELTEIALGQTTNIEAREIFQEGWENYQRYSADDNAVAISQFEKALGLDPSYERAYAGLGLAYLRGCKLRWNQPLGMSVSEANSLALSNLKFLDNIKGRQSSLAKVAASRIYLYNNRYQKAVMQATRAIAQDPNDPEAYIAMAWAMITTGNPEAGLELVERAMRLNPSYPNYYALARGMAYFAIDDLDKAADVFAEVIEREPDAIQLALPLAATYAHLGKKEDARAALLLWEPGANQQELTNIRYNYHFPYEWSGDDSVMDRLFAGLEHAALPPGVTVTSLIEMLSHENKFKRLEAIKILRLFGSAAEPAIPALIEILRAEEQLTRQQTVTTLGEIGPAAEAAIPYLEVLLEEEGRIGYQAANALGKIEGM